MLKRLFSGIAIGSHSTYIPHNSTSESSRISYCSFYKNLILVWLQNTLLEKSSTNSRWKKYIYIQGQIYIQSQILLGQSIRDISNINISKINASQWNIQ